MKRVVQVFAKAPVAGEVKTRLHPALGAQGAADLHRALVERTLSAACSPSWDGSPADRDLPAIELWCAPDAGHPFFADCARRFRVALRSQQGADLGERMHFALSDALVRGAIPVLIGTDCPALGPAQIHDAFEAIDPDGADPDDRDARCTADVVLLPAEDGGYMLIGARRVDRSLFDGIAWSTPAVLEQTVERIAELGWRLHRMAPGWDVDRPEDLDRLRALAPELFNAMEA